jgi:hypothetical protein
MFIGVPLFAQRRPIELGIDLGAEFSRSSGQTTTTVAIPGQVLRAAFPLTGRIAVEPRLALMTHSAGGSSDSRIVPVAGVIYDFSADVTQVHPYLRLFGGMLLLGGSGTSSNQAFAGGGIGMRLPIISRLAARFEASTAYGFKNDAHASFTDVAIAAGFSFFTK